MIHWLGGDRNSLAIVNLLDQPLKGNKNISPVVGPWRGYQRWISMGLISFIAAAFPWSYQWLKCCANRFKGAETLMKHRFLLTCLCVSATRICPGFHFLDSWCLALGTLVFLLLIWPGNRKETERPVKCLNNLLDTERLTGPEIQNL